jgi:NDP-sugar pyrophosphorylase family protein
MAITDS